MASLSLWSEKPRALPAVTDIHAFIAVSDRPWQLPVDTLVVAERVDAQSPLDLTLARAFPSLEWDRVRRRAGELDEPLRLEVRDGLERVGGLSRIVFSPAPGRRLLAETCARGVEKADLALGTRLAVYVHGYTPQQLQAALRPGSIRGIVGEQADDLDRLILVVSSAEEAAAVAAAWGSPDRATGEVEWVTDAGTDQVLSGGISVDLVRGDRGIPVEADRLGVAPYVSMLATTIARRDTPLPLSVGVFGPWGSGKSYFMGLLRDQVGRRARSGDAEYVSEVVQIGFNAWSYADANLWASLGNEIFGQLLDADEDGAQTGSGGEKDKAARWRRAAQVERLRTELRTQLTAVRNLDLAKIRAEQDTVRIRADLLESRKRHRISLRSLARAAGRAGAAEDLGELWKRVGITDEVDQGKRLASEAGAVREDLSTAGILLRGRSFTAGAIIGVLLLLAVVVLVLTGRPAAWIAGAGLGGAAAWLATVTLFVGRARSGLTRLTRILAELQEADLAREVAAVRDAETREAVLEEELRARLVRTAELDAEIIELTPGRRLYRFLAERVGTSAYRDELGLVSTIRRDLHVLVRLLAEWRTGPVDSPGPIERIILYIDDLDRCPPHRVSEVLQAVHLLLALELFVVVVGVDSRWLLRSLASEYEGLLVADDAVRPTEPGWSSPQDYLEKIFNIPFVVPGLRRGGYGELIRGLAAGDTAAVTYSDQLTAANGDGIQAASASDSVIEAGSEIGAVAAGRPVAPTPVTEEELMFLTALAPFARSPREAKRMFNIYRMLRATRDLNGSFLGSAGEYQAVAILLGCQMAAPRLLDQILWAAPVPERRAPGGLAHRPISISWSHVVRGLMPRLVDGTWSNDVSPGMTESDASTWREFIRQGEAASALVALPDLAAFRRWAPHVSCFSFENPRWN